MSNWDKYGKAAEKGPFSLFMKVFLLVIGISVVLGAARFVVYPFWQARRVMEKTLDADNMIYNYEWFKQRHEAIAAIERKIQAANLDVNTFKESAGERKDWGREDKIEFSRLNSISSGLEMQRADLAAEYNARSRMVNRSIFKAGDVELPERIPE